MTSPGAITRLDGESGGYGGGIDGRDCGRRWRRGDGGSKAEAEMFEVGLAEGHEAGVKVAPDEQNEEGDGSVVLVLQGVDDGGGEVQSQYHFDPGHPAGAFAVAFLYPGALVGGCLSFRG